MSVRAEAPGVNVRSWGAKERQRSPWALLYAVLFAAAALCGLGYHLAGAVGRSVLLQLTVAGIVIGLLWAWTRLYRSALQAGSAAVVSREPFAVIRLRFSRRDASVPHPAPFARATPSPHGVPAPQPASESRRA